MSYEVEREREVSNLLAALPLEFRRTWREACLCGLWLGFSLGLIVGVISAQYYASVVS